MFGELTDILFSIIISLFIIFILYKFNKWLLKKDGILKIIYIFLEKTDTQENQSSTK